MSYVFRRARKEILLIVSLFCLVVGACKEVQNDESAALENKNPKTVASDGQNGGEGLNQASSPTARPDWFVLFEIFFKKWALTELRRDGPFILDRETVINNYQKDISMPIGTNTKPIKYVGSKLGELNNWNRPRCELLKGSVIQTSGIPKATKMVHEVFLNGKWALGLYKGTEYERFQYESTYQFEGSTPCPLDARFAQKILNVKKQEFSFQKGELFQLESTGFVVNVKVASVPDTRTPNAYCKVGDPGILKLGMTCGALRTGRFTWDH